MAPPALVSTRSQSTQPNVRWKNGAWRIQAFSHVAPDGTKKYAYRSVREPNTARGQTKAEAEAVMLRASLDARHAEEEARGTPDHRTVGMTLDDYLTWGMSPNRRHRGKRRPMAPSSLNTLASNIRTLKAFEIEEGVLLGDFIAVDLTSRMLNEMYEQMLDIDERAESTVAKYHSALCAALERDRKDGMLRTNAAMDIQDKPSQAPRAIILPPEADIERLFGFCSDDLVMVTWLLLAVSFGARRGSIGALRWRHIDLDRGKVLFEDALSDGGRHFGGVQIKDLKADNPYTATLNPVEVEQLGVLRDRQRRAFGPGWSEECFAFSLDGGETFMHPSTASHRFARLRDKAEVKITLHKLKTYAVTSLLQDGISLPEVAFRTGTTIQTLIRRYAKFIDGADQRSAEAMETRQSRLLGKGKGQVRAIR